jgi:hypothetical protein
MKAGDTAANLFDDACALMTKNASCIDARNIAFENVEVSAADGCFGDPHNGISGLL